MPWADGTECGLGRWCQRGSCVAVSPSPAPVHGQWGAWQPWSKCSRSCGGGVSQAGRACDSPVPQHGGSFCLGDRVRYQSCNTVPCPAHTDFRLEQCAAHNTRQHNIPDLPAAVTWIPKYTDCE